MVSRSITNSLYDKLPNLVLGFHGCRKDVWEKVLHGHEHLKKSENSYDWLGNGIYFWENSYERAADWAENRYGDDAAVIGAVISLGHCLNLTDYRSATILKIGYDLLSEAKKASGQEMPINTNGRSKTDLLLRNLDCAVIEYIHFFSRKSMYGLTPYDSVRGVFTEGSSAYPGSGIPEKTHTQICIVNPNCIKGYFSPIEPEKGFSIP